MYKAGFCEADITPPLGSIIPGGFAARYNKGITDRIYARAAVLDDGAVKLAIAVIDACGIYRDVAERVRARVAGRCDILPGHIMVMADHIHAGGPTLNWGEEVVIDPAYIDRIVCAAADCIVTANADLREVRLLNAAREVDDVGFIRVYRMKNGGMKTNPGKNNPEIEAPYTTPDPELRVLCAAEGSKPIGAIVNFACHPACVAGSMTSADYIGVLSRALKRAYGQDFVTVFVNGACGNINHINPFDPATFVPDRYVYMGERLAQNVVSLLADAPSALSGRLAAAEAPVTLGFRRPDEAAVLAAYRHFERLGASYAEMLPSSRGYVETFFARQALERLLDRQMSVDTSVQVFDLAGVKLFGYAAQMFTEYGKATKTLCPGSMVAIFANDYLGYCPVPEAMVPGVYEARLCATSHLEPAAGAKLLAAAEEALAKLM